MLIKVYGGTSPETTETLCETCRHARIGRGRRMEEEIVFCTALLMQSVRIPFKVTSCSDYVDSREPAIHELLEKAWILRAGSKRRAAGFVRADDLTRDEIARLLMHSRDD
jgi:hypothetical protein